MQGKQHTVSDTDITNARDAARLGMSLSGIASLIGMSASHLYDWMRIGETSSALSAIGKTDQEISVLLSSGIAIVSEARSLYNAIETGRSLGEQSALQALDTLVKGYNQDDPAIPVIPSSLSAIKLRLSLSDRYSTSPALSSTSKGDYVLERTTTERLSLSDLQQRKDRALQASYTVEAETDSITDE